MSKNAKPIVVVDIDGVLFETPIDSVAAANQQHGTSLQVTDIFNHHAEHDKTKFTINNQDQFYKFQLNNAGHRQVAGARRALEQLTKRATVVALTARDYDYFGESTHKVISKHYGDLISNIYFTTGTQSGKKRQKGEIIKELGGFILVDDALKHCENAVAHGVPAILIAQPYNRSGHNYPANFRAANWDDAVRIIERELGLAGA